MSLQPIMVFDVAGHAASSLSAMAPAMYYNATRGTHGHRDWTGSSPAPPCGQEGTRPWRLYGKLSSSAVGLSSTRLGGGCALLRVDNASADYLSRRRPDPLEWFHHSIVLQLVLRRGSPRVDLFASHLRPTTPVVPPEP